MRTTTTPAGLAFEEGRLVGTVGFDFDSLDADEAELRDAELAKYRQEVVRNLLCWLAQSKGAPHAIGVKVLVLAHILGQRGTRATLAKRLRVSRQRVHQILTAMKRETPHLRSLRAL